LTFNGVQYMRLSSQTRRPHVTLAAQSLAAGAAAIGQPAFRQVHNISPIGIVADVLTPFGQTPAEVGFETRLTEIISASPDRRTKSKSELIKIGVTEFGISRRRADALREKVIARLGASAWKASGRPRKN
jgi:hypothetical protein